MDAINVLIYYLYEYTPFIVGTAVIVLGILITVNRNTYCRALGISSILSGLQSILSACPRILLESGMGEMYGNISWVFNLSVMITGISSTIFLCLFFHRRYGKKFIYIPILLLGVGGSLINSIVAVLLGRTLGGGQTSAYWISMVNTIDSFVISTATAVIIIIIFFRNRGGEKVIPKAWLVRLITLIIYAIETALVCCFYAYLIKNPGPIQGSMETIYYLFTIIFSCARLILPAYVLYGTVRNKISNIS